MTREGTDVGSVAASLPLSTSVSTSSYALTAGCRDGLGCGEPSAPSSSLQCTTSYVWSSATFVLPAGWELDGEFGMAYGGVPM
jgi:hypothetical protein